MVYISSGRIHVRIIIMLSLLFTLSCGPQKDEMDQQDDEALMVKTINREREMNFSLKAGLIGSMDPMAQILCYRDMEKISPDSLGIFADSNISFQAGEDTSRGLFLFGENSEYSIELEFQREWDNPAWHFNKAVIQFKNRDMDFFNKVKDEMDNLMLFKAADATWDSTQNYSWEISPTLVSSINGFATPDTTIITFEISKKRIDES